MLAIQVVLSKRYWKWRPDVAGKFRTAISSKPALQARSRTRSNGAKNILIGFGIGRPKLVAGGIEQDAAAIWPKKVRHGLKVERRRYVLYNNCRMHKVERTVSLRNERAFYLGELDIVRSSVPSRQPDHLVGDIHSDYGTVVTRERVGHPPNTASEVKCPIPPRREPSHCSPGQMLLQPLVTTLKKRRRVPIGSIGEYRSHGIVFGGIVPPGVHFFEIHCVGLTELSCRRDKNYSLWRKRWARSSPVRPRIKKRKGTREMCTSP